MKVLLGLALIGISLVLVTIGIGRMVEARRGRALNDALISAVARGDATRVSALLRSGADPNTRDQAGWSALTQAKAGHQPDVVRLLVRAGGRE